MQLVKGLAVYCRKKLHLKLLLTSTKPLELQLTVSLVTYTKKSFFSAITSFFIFSQLFFYHIVPINGIVKVTFKNVLAVDNSCNHSRCDIVPFSRR